MISQFKPLLLLSSLTLHVTLVLICMSISQTTTNGRKQLQHTYKKEHHMNESEVVLRVYIRHLLSSDQFQFTAGSLGSLLFCSLLGLLPITREGQRPAFAVGQTHCASEPVIGQHRFVVWGCELAPLGVLLEDVLVGEWGWSGWGCTTLRR